MAVTTTGTAVRTLTEALRAAGPQALADLIRLRPDLAYPVPGDLADLTSRATTATSVARALDGLDAWQRQTALALATLADPATVREAASVLRAAPPTVTETVAELRRRGLVWGADDQLHLVRAVREHFGSYPAGLAPVSPRPLAADEVPELLTAAGPGAREVVERLLWSPAGTVPGAERPVSVTTARSAVERLLARRLLRPTGPDTVLLPREVAWALRGERLTADDVPASAPELAIRRRSVRLVDNGAAGAANSLLHDLDLVVATVDEAPVRLLRNGGGLGQRDLAALAGALGGDLRYATFVVEAAAAGDLIAADGPQLAVTTAYDGWGQQDGLSRWRQLARTWLGSPRLWSGAAETVGHALGPEAELPRMIAVRRAVLEVAWASGVGAGIDPESLTEHLGWLRPGLLRVGALDLGTAVDRVRAELEWLGLQSQGALSSLGALLADATAPATGAVAAMFPAPVEELILQADLTAVAPGALASHTAAELRLLADQESRGGGGVYRFSAGAIRRAFDAGWSAAQVHDWLTRHSRTGVPQPLSYLVDDVARRHGSVRVGAAGSYLRIEDEAQTAVLLAHPEARTLGLRQIAPGVVVSAADPYEVVELLRRIGQSPTAEDAGGRALTSPAKHRVRPTHRSEPPPPLPADEVAAMVLAGPAPRELPSQSTAEALLRLAAATRDARPVRIGYVTPDGDAQERTVTPLDLDGGQLRGVDAEGARLVAIALARISFVRESDSPN